MAKKSKVPEGIEPIKIGHRTFVIEENPSFLQDMYINDLVHEMGLDDVDVTKLNGSRLDVEAKKLVSKAYRSGRLFDLLGAMFVEQGADPLEWTEQTANDTGNLLKTIRDRESKHAIERNMVVILLSFFATGLTSTGVSLNSSSQIEAAEPGVQNQSEEPSTTGTGKKLSARSQEAIRIAEERLRGGRSVRASSPTSN